MKHLQTGKPALRAAAVQFESLPGDKSANFHKIESFVEQAAAQGVRLIVFPECCITGYWFIRNLSVEQLAALAEPIPDGPSTQRLIGLARDTASPWKPVWSKPARPTCSTTVTS